MSQEINTSSTPPEKPATRAPEKRGKSTLAYWIAILVLAGICVWLYVNRQHVTQQNTVIVQQNDSLATSRQAVEDDYKAALARLDQMSTQNAGLDSALHGREGEISKMRAQIDAIMKDSRASAGQLNKARDLIGSLNGKISSYEEQIAKLEAQNTNLTHQNETISKQRDSTATQNMNLKKVGSVLHASNIRLTPLHLTHKGRKEKTTSKARKVDVLRITFDIDENRIAESGTKQLYFRIMGPNGNMLSNAAYGSGAITTDNGQLPYTLEQDIALQQGQPVKNITADWQQDSDYARGTYTIEIYNEGYKIGQATVALH